jgi:hypothetical protein
VGSSGRLREDSLIARCDGLLSAHVEHEIVFINPAMDRYLALDETGRRIWELIAQPRRITDIVAELQAAYDGDGEAIAQDVMRFLEQLVQEGLVRVIDRAPA